MKHKNRFSLKYADVAFEEKCVGKEVCEAEHQVKTEYDLGNGVKLTNVCTLYDEFVVSHRWVPFGFCRVSFKPPSVREPTSYSATL